MNFGYCSPTKTSQLSLEIAEKIEADYRAARVGVKRIREKLENDKNLLEIYERLKMNCRDAFPWLGLMQEKGRMTIRELEERSGGVQE